jgi:hypothetical protein
MMGSEANRVANARVTGLKNARWSKINKYKGFVKQKQLAKFVEEPKPRRPRPHKPTLSVTTEELHANHVFVLHIFEPELATTLVVAELERAKALGRGAGAKIRDHPSRLDYTVGAKMQLNQRLQNQSKRYTQDLLPDGGVDYAVRTAVQPLLECALASLSPPCCLPVARTLLITHRDCIGSTTHSPHEAGCMLPVCRRLDVMIVPGILIDSKASTQTASRQMFHKDFNPEKVDWHHAAQTEKREKCTYPWTLLVMLSGEGHVYVSMANGQLVKLHVPHGSGALFRGDVLHAGGAYPGGHTRAHWYLTPARSAHAQTAADWRSNKDGEVALFEEDPLGEWDEVSSRQEPHNVVAVHRPCIYTVTQLRDCPYLRY